MNTQHFVPHTRQAAGFTLIETLVAITLLALAIVAPMSLAAKSLQSAYYARDQIVASYLAQEAIESIRVIRDNNILSMRASGSGDPFDGIPIATFLIDARTLAHWESCESGPLSAIPLKTDGGFYGYGADACNQSDPAWTPTQFYRTVTITRISDTELRVTATVTWQSSVFASRSFSISDSLYKWAQ